MIPLFSCYEGYLFLPIPGVLHLSVSRFASFHVTEVTICVILDYDVNYIVDEGRVERTGYADVVPGVSLHPSVAVSALEQDLLLDTLVGLHEFCMQLSAKCFKTLHAKSLH